MTDKEKLQCMQLGSFITSGQLLEDSNLTKLASIKTSSDHSLDRRLAKSICNFIQNNSDFEESNQSHFLFQKVANTSDKDWNNFHDEVIDCWVKVAHPLLLSTVPLASAGLGFATSVVNNVPRAIETAVPLVASSTGKSLVEVERMINENDLTTEKLQAKIIKYKLLTAKLDREINKRFSKKDKELVLNSIK